MVILRVLSLALIASMTLAPSCSGPSQQRWERFANVTSTEGTMAEVLIIGPALSAVDAARAANLIGCGVEIQVPGPVTGNLLLSARCADAEQLGIRVVGPGPLTGGVQASCVGADCAWVSVEGLEVTPVDDDAFDSAADAGLLVIDSTGWVSGEYNNVLTSHGHSRLLALNVSGGATGADPAPPIAITGDSRATIITRGGFETGSSGYDEVVNLGGSNGGNTHLTLIGARLSCNGSPQHAIDFEPGIGGLAKLDTAKVRFDCGVDLLLDAASEKVAWYSILDDLAPQTLPLPIRLNRELDLRFTAPTLTKLPLAVPIPAWVNGWAASDVQVFRY